MDLRVELRSRVALHSSVIFAALVLVIFNFARDPGQVSKEALAPSVLWVTVAFAGVIALNRSFTLERENWAMDGLLLAPVSRSEEQPVHGPVLPLQGERAVEGDHPGERDRHPQDAGGQGLFGDLARVAGEVEDDQHQRRENDRGVEGDAAAELHAEVLPGERQG